MTTESAHAKFLWNVEEMAAAFRWHASQRDGLQRGFMRAALIFLGYFGLNRLMLGDATQGALVLFFGGVLAAHQIFVRPWKLRRQFAQRPDRDTEIEWEITPDNIRIRNALGGAELKWDELAKVVQTPDGFLFYTAAEIFHWLPHYAVSYDEEYPHFTEMVRTRAPQFRKLG